MNLIVVTIMTIVYILSIGFGIMRIMIAIGFWMFMVFEIIKHLLTIDDCEQSCKENNGKVFPGMLVNKCLIDSQQTYLYSITMFNIAFDSECEFYINKYRNSTIDRDEIRAWIDANKRQLHKFKIDINEIYMTFINLNDNKMLSPNAKDVFMLKMQEIKEQDFRFNNSFNRICTFFN